MSSKTARRRRVPPRGAPSAAGPRAPRRAKERPERSGPTPALRASPRRLYAWAIAAGLLAGALLITFSQVSAHRADEGATAGGVRAPAFSVVAGIPQRGNALGAPDAPVRLIEYSDLQCPFCAQFAVQVLPTLIGEYVRTGKVEVVYRGLAFIGPGSVTALRTATAAGRQDRLWNLIDLLYRQQGAENAWVNDELLRSLTARAGADVERVFADRDRPAVTAAMARWARDAEADGVRGTPSFYVGRRGEAPEPLPLRTMAMSEFRSALDRALAR